MSDLTTEDFPVVGGLPLRLSFTPDAIREHFDGDDDGISEKVESMTDDQLAEVGASALMDDRLYGVFHEVLCDALSDEEVQGK